VLAFANGGGPRQHHPRVLPPYSPELNPQEHIWGEIREKIFKNYALKSTDEVCHKLVEAALYIERNRGDRQIHYVVSIHPRFNMICKWYE
jgi:DDE superfamily endonuclease